MRTKIHCPVHDVPLICPVCVGASGGSMKSEAKANASRNNGKLGGRPRKEANLNVQKKRKGK